MIRYLRNIVNYVYVVVYCLALSRIYHLLFGGEKGVGGGLVGGVTGAGGGLSCSVRLMGRVGDKVLVFGRQIILEPRVSPELGGSGAIISVYLHAPHDDVARPERYVVWNVEFTGANFGVEFFVILPFIWKLATEKGVEKDA